MRELNQAKFIERLNQYLNDNNKKCSDFSVECGYDRSYLPKIMNNTAWLTDGVCNTLAEKTGQSINYWRGLGEDKPFIAQRLGVEVDEQFQIEGLPDVTFVILPGGRYETVPVLAGGSAVAIVDAINNPSLVSKLPIREFTEADKELARKFGTKYVCRDQNSTSFINLYKNKPRDISWCGVFLGNCACCINIDTGYFQGVQPGDCIKIFEDA